ncbi:MAG: dTDP-4-dehydrorhamnose reductase [Pseudomonadales bacterium]
MTRVLVTGAGGQLGRCLSVTVPSTVDGVFCHRDQFDLSAPETLQAKIESLQPDVVINCAAYTNVDGAEAEPAQADLINHLGVAALARVCQQYSVKLIHVSTDFVFDGNASTPYQIQAITAPEGEYGKSKWLGEQAVQETLPLTSLVIRTSWLYSEFGANFVKTMLRLFATKENFQVVKDQFGSPTYARGLAALIWHIVTSGKVDGGILHWSDAGVTNWFEFAEEIGRQGLQLGLIERMAEITPTTAAEYGAAAPRPAYSALECRETQTRHPDIRQVPWRDNLKQMLVHLQLLDGTETGG